MTRESIFTGFLLFRGCLVALDLLHPEDRDGRCADRNYNENTASAGEKEFGSNLYPTVRSGMMCGRRGERLRREVRERPALRDRWTSVIAVAPCHGTSLAERVAWQRRVMTPGGRDSECGVGVEFLGAAADHFSALEDFIDRAPEAVEDV